MNGARVFSQTRTTVHRMTPVQDGFETDSESCSVAQPQNPSPRPGSDAESLHMFKKNE